MREERPNHAAAAARPSRPGSDRRGTARHGTARHGTARQREEAVARHARSGDVRFIERSGGLPAALNPPSDWSDATRAEVRQLRDWLAARHRARLSQPIVGYI
ncbi:hypothetical protein DBV15_06516 [Temnothorax longispinosus]|uniref:Uncharacterized protein n=1 Tax=Temnothorax longispinosus TaxID=300112 RepID=A0A4S2KA32_9HYME|nr:hypothetical protein DBV15_06516 [Temnothorax longispinosus]